MRLSFLCLFFPIFQKAAPTGVLSKTKSWGQRESRESVCLFATLQYQTWAFLFMGLNLHPPQYIMYIMPWSICLFCSSTALSGFLFPPHLAFCFHCLCLLVCPSASFYVCVEIPLEFAGQGGALEEMDFSLSTEWNLATGICRSQFNLSSKLEGWRRVKMLEKEALYVLLTCNSVTPKCFFCVVFKVQDGRHVQLTRLCMGKLSQHVIEVICNNNSTQVRCFQGATH